MLFENKASGKITTQQYIKSQESLSQQHEDMTQQIEKLKAEILDLQYKQDILKENKSRLLEYLQTDILTRQMVTDFVDCISVYEDRSFRIQWKFDEPNQ